MQQSVSPSVCHYSGSYAWKPALQRLLRPLVGWMAAHGVRANGISGVALCLSAIAGLALWGFPRQSALWIGLPVVLSVRMALNAMDGMLAREYGQQSAAGMYWNELGDLASDAFLLAPFARLDGVNGWALAVVFLLLALSEMAGLLGLATGGVRRYEGLLGKSDRALLLALLALWVAATGGLPGWMAVAFPMVMTASLAVTIGVRVRNGVHASGGPHAHC
jgi:CDP-diacylglycerol--glycerol-3-phosphate 3-phosphatidyltransferase